MYNFQPASNFYKQQQPKPIHEQRPTEFCTRHSEQNVGYVPTSKQIVCNQCIYQSKAQNVEFSALICKKLTADYSKSLDKFKNDQKALT